MTLGKILALERNWRWRKIDARIESALQIFENVYKIFLWRADSNFVIVSARYELRSSKIENFHLRRNIPFVSLHSFIYCLSYLPETDFTVILPC